MDDELTSWVEAVRAEQHRADQQRLADRAELKEALHHACQAAKRCPYIVGTAEYPSRWDRAHIHVDDLLDQIVGR